MKRAGRKGACAPFALGAVAVLFLAAASGLRAESVAPRVGNLPAPGSYLLNRIQRVPGARLLDRDGKPAQIADFTRGAVTALGFFYGHCVDPAGCPVAWSTFEAARREANDDPLLKSRLRLVFVSLDPTHDTPSALRLLEEAEGAAGTPIPWKFLTSGSDDDLAPLLREMGQRVSFETDAAGRRTGAVNHMLKVFLIDPDGWVREIYTTAFLSPESLLNDARTLALAFPRAANREAP